MECFSFCNNWKEWEATRQNSSFHKKTLRGVVLWVFDLLSGASAIADLPNKGEGLTIARKNSVFILMAWKRQGIELHSIPTGHIQSEILVLNTLYSIIPVLKREIRKTQVATGQSVLPLCTARSWTRSS